MTARTHDMAAVALLVAVVVVTQPGTMTVATALTALLANQLGGIAPDVDQPTAPFWRNLPVGRYFGRVFGALVGGHRFLCHSILGVAAFGVLSKLFLEFVQPLMPRVDIGFVWFAFMIGMVSHLIMDAFTKEGIPLFLPLPYKIGIPPFRRFRITTGKKVELLVVFPLLIAVTVWLCSTNYNELTTLIHSHLVK